jgi:hypothetical protein
MWVGFFFKKKRAPSPSEPFADNIRFLAILSPKELNL